MIEAMVDNETWGIRTTSVVRSVGIVVFDGSTVLEKHYFRIDEVEQHNDRPLSKDLSEATGVMWMQGRTQDQSTIEWWAQPENAKAQETIREAPLVSWMDGRTICGKVGDKVQRVWAKPGMFDLPMLRDLFGQDIWSYWKEADLATLLLEFDPFRKTRPEFKGTPHNALDDALHAHEWLIRLRNAIPHIVAERELEKQPVSKIWTCKIGECTEEEVRKFFAAPDSPMREAIQVAYKSVTGKDADFLFSGWDGHLTTAEREVVEGQQ